MKAFPDVTLVAASVPRTATFKDAADALRTEPISTIAVLDENAEIVGLFGEEELLRGLFPRYLAELHHTAFTEDDEALLARRVREVQAEPIEKHTRDPVTMDIDASATHVAERFLHCDFEALPIVEKGKFIGMLRRADVSRAVMTRFGSGE